jgi:hypothetical protein
MSDITCDYCGSEHARSIELPSAFKLECDVCMSVEFVWKDNESDDEETAGAVF